MRAGLPAGINAVGEPDLAVRLRRGELPAGGLAEGIMVGTGRQFHRRHALAAPDGGDAQEIGVETDPAIAPEIEDQTARGEIVRREAGAGFARIENRGEERKVRLDPGGPWRRIRTLGRRCGCAPAGAEDESTREQDQGEAPDETGTNAWKKHGGGHDGWRGQNSWQVK